MRVAIVLLFAALVSAAQALPPVIDLGDGLSYRRIHALPEDLPATAGAKPSPCVVDLRFARSDERGASALKSWVTFNASTRTPVFILLNARTARVLAAAFPAQGLPGLVVIAPKDSGIPADAAVRVGPEEDRKAYDALDRGADPATLLRDYPDKPRVDEAYLEREHIPDSQAPDPETDLDAPPRPLVDLMLQRALQLHRGLVALKRE